ncbi:MAG: hypothetical protein AAGA54_23455 [Myxococcota bacterium]
MVCRFGWGWLVASGVLMACGPTVATPQTEGGSGSTSGAAGDEGADASTRGSESATSTGGVDASADGSSSDESSGTTGDGKALCSTLTEAPELNEAFGLTWSADVDGDGLRELWWLEDDGEQTTLRGYAWGDGAGVLLDGRTVDASSLNVGFGDVDGDGRDDALLRSAELADDTAWLRGGADGLEPTLRPHEGPANVGEGLGDFDLDGDVDQIALTVNDRGIASTHVFEGDGNGEFVAAGVGLDLRDRFWWVGVGRSRQLWALSRPESLAIGSSDIRWSELAWSPGGLQVVSTVQPLLGGDQALLGFVGVTEPRSSSAPDILVAVEGTLEVWTGGPVQSMQREILAADVRSAGVADFDADGRTDALLVDAEGGLRVAWGTVTGFEPLEAFPEAVMGRVDRSLSRVNRGDAIVLWDSEGPILLTFDPCR